MNEAEYKKQIELIDQNAKAQKIEVARQFIAKTAYHLMGKVVYDGVHRVMVNKINFRTSPNNLPEAILYGFALNKNLKPFKDQRIELVYQFRIKNVL